jgi:hypothetical protein
VRPGLTQTGLTPSLFIKVPVPSQESKQSCIWLLGVPRQESKQSCIWLLGVPSQESKQSCIWLLGVSIFPLFTNFLFDSEV